MLGKIDSKTSTDYIEDAINITPTKMICSQPSKSTIVKVIFYRIKIENDSVEISIHSVG